MKIRLVGAPEGDRYVQVGEGWSYRWYHSIGAKIDDVGTHPYRDDYECIAPGVYQFRQREWAPK